MPVRLSCDRVNAASASGLALVVLRSEINRDGVLFAVSKVMIWARRSI